jgi:predicted RNA-binding Zn ribbon-like protein
MDNLPVSNKLPPALFLADSRGLDFLNSIATPLDVPVDWISNGRDFLAWLEQSGTVSKAALAAVARGAVPGELDAIAARARALREWFRGFVKKHQGKPLKRSALAELAPLNQLLSRDESFWQIGAREHEHAGDRDGADAVLDLRMERRWRSADMLLLPIARALAEVVTECDFTYVRACEGPVCTLYFVDRTRARARRWCSMSVCGNRAKQAARRGRARG